MPKRRRISFLARIKVKRKVSFKAGKKRVTFSARVPTKRRRRVTFLSKKKKN
jgi:hypothetical protein